MDPSALSPKTAGMALKKVKLESSPGEKEDNNFVGVFVDIKQEATFEEDEMESLDAMLDEDRNSNLPPSCTPHCESAEKLDENQVVRVWWSKIRGRALFINCAECDQEVEITRVGEMDIHMETHNYNVEEKENKLPCGHCGTRVNVRDIAGHLVRWCYLRLYKQLSPIKATWRMVGDGGVRCPFCNKNTKIINLMKHLRKIHNYYAWPKNQALLGCEICGLETIKISDIANHQHELGPTSNEENKETRKIEHLAVQDDEADSTKTDHWTGATPVHKVENKRRVHHANKDGWTCINSTEKVTEDAREVHTRMFQI